jgi:hypothetical protein
MKLLPQKIRMHLNIFSIHRLPGLSTPPPLSFFLSFKHILMNTLMFKMCNNISTVTMETLDGFKSTSFIKMVIATFVQHTTNILIAKSTRKHSHPPSSVQVTSQPGCQFTLAVIFYFFLLEKIISAYAKDFCNKPKAIIHQISKENKIKSPYSYNRFE